LGTLTPEVKELRDRFGFPGMRVLQFAFGNDAESKNYLPHSYIRRCVAYTGTHDNDTTVGWYRDEGSPSSTRSKEETREQRRYAAQYANSSGREIQWDLIRLLYESVADTVIIPAQDVLGLGSDARMNLPGTTKGNWEWRLTPGVLNSKIAERLSNLSHVYDRIDRKP
jgi:4-alpha-glucanotransferase